MKRMRFYAMPPWQRLLPTTDMIVFNTPKELVNFVNDTFNSTSANQVLFGFEEMDKSDARSPRVLYRIIALTYSAIYAKWLHYGRKCIGYAQSKHAKNAFNVLQTVYKAQPFNLDVIIYVISECKKDALELNENSFFHEFFDNGISFKYSSLYEILRSALDAGVYQPADITEKLGIVIQDMKLLTTLEIAEKRDKLSTTVTLSFNGTTYNCHDFLIYENSALHMLCDRVVIDGNLERRYRSLENFTNTIKIEKLGFN